MSGDVQPRKRKDKKKKKDELGLEEPRGTAAALGDGDVFLHSQHEHGTGGHWCAKIIFFSLLAVLITLIGLIILENRGLTELEANSVESKYSGVLEGWIEEAPEDDHYDEHTLDLNHPEEEDEDNHVHKSDEEHDIANEHDVEEEDDEYEQDEDDDEDNESNELDSSDADENDNNEEISEENIGETEEIEDRISYRYNYKEKYNTYDDDDDDDGDDDENDDDDEDEEEVDDKDELASEEVKENSENLSDEKDLSNEQEDDDDIDDVYNDIDDNVAQQESNDDDEDDKEENYQADSDENDIEENFVQEDAEDDEDDEIEKIEAEKSDEIEEQDDDDDSDNDALQEDDEDEPPVEQITIPPAGKPFIEIEEQTTVKPIDTLAEEVEYERRQEELRKEKEEQGSQIWLKLAVGGALLVATHAVLRRATARDAPEPEDRSREDTPSMADRRMTLIPDEPVVQQRPQTNVSTARPIVDEEVFKKPAPVVKNEPMINPNILEEVKEKKTSVEESKPIEKVQEYEQDDEAKELYSDEEEIVEEEEEEEEIEEPPRVIPQQKAQAEPEEVPEDVEIIDDEQIEEEVEEEEEDEDEEEISDVDDTELLSRLEAKYGRLPEPERPGKQKDGGNSIEDEWPGEPMEPYWREQLDIAEEELRQGSLASCEKRVSAPELAGSGRARWILARAIDATAEAKRDNKLLSKAISGYLNLLKMNERLSDRKLVEVARRTINRIEFRGIYLNAEPIYRLLIRRFPQDINYRNNLTVSFLMANRADLADEVLRETLKLWPNDRVALAHHGFVLKNQYNKLEEAVVALQQALEGDTGHANEPRFYYHLGDALLLLGRFEEAHEVHVRGAKLGHFLSPAQRSLYNVPHLRGRPWWPVEETPYVKLAQALEKSWREILKEGEAAKELYEKEKEGLKEKGEWSQLDIFVRGREIPGRCDRAPVTCAIVKSEAAAAGCRRGQVKFSAMAGGTHVRAHVGPTNCRLRLHLALSNTKDTFIRVDKEIRQWQLGKTFIFDDSFEHEVWHNGTGTRLVLIVDLWHPDLTPQERRRLPAI